MKVIDLGLVDFNTAYSLQERLAAEVFTGSAAETLLLLEHQPVYTIGSGGSEANVLDPSIQLRRINRGGDVTFHGPGQLVGYPIVDLGRRGRDLHRYLRFLEELLIRVAAEFGVDARRLPGRTGVWTGEGKLASIGVGVRRWVTMHGFALNVANDPAPFSRINPCGMAACPITSLAAAGEGEVTLAAVRQAVALAFAPLLAEWLPETRMEEL